MIPVLFKGNETNFNHNGIGLLKDTLSCEVSEARNGSFDLELVYPITGPYFKDLKNGNIVQAKPNDTDLPHNFRITEIDKTLYDKEVMVYGVSITNDLGGNMVKSLYLEDVTPQVILNEMKNVLHYPTTFNFVSNITTVGTVNGELNNPLNLIVGEEGSLVDIFGGEVKRTNDTLFLYGRRGKDNVTTIRSGKNLDGFKMTESFQGKYTQILPYFKYEAEIPGEIAGDTEGETIRQEVTVFGSVVSSPYHGRYPVNAIKPVDFSQNETVRDAKTLDALNAEASRYFSDLYSEIDKPSVNINVDMIQLVDSEQYELYEKLEKIELTDTVSVYVPEYDVDVLVKITELKYDSLRERTISIVAGSSGRTSLMDEISGSYKQFTKTLVDDKIQSATSGIINQILTKKDGGNVYAGRATPPDNAKIGDIWFKDTGGGDVELYEFDGVNWIRKMYKGFGDDVRQLVDDKIAESNVIIAEALEEHDNTIAQALTKAVQAQADVDSARTDITDKLKGYVTNQTYTTYTIDRQQTDRQITEQITETVSKVPTGPVNLVINGFDPQTLSPWKLGDTTNWTLELTTHGLFYNGTKKLMRFKTSTVTTKGTFESNVFNLKRNTKYTIRVGIFANSNCKDLRFCFGRGTATSISDYSMVHAWFVGSTSKLEYKTITVDSGNYDYGKLTFNHNGTKTVGQSADMYIAEISIIEGEYNNSWTPSFDELITEQKFNETKSTVDAFSRAIGTRDETRFVPNIARLVMTQDAVISEVAKYGEHNNNLIVDATSHAQTEATGGASLTRYPLQNRIDFSRSGATASVNAGIACKIHSSSVILGEKYTFSFEYYLHSAPDTNLIMILDDGSKSLTPGSSFATPTTEIGVWHKNTVTFPAINNSAPGSNSIRFRIYVVRNASVAIKNIMLVRGDKIGPFSTSQVDIVSTRVEQTANSYSIKFLNNANDITTQLNLTNSGVRIKSSLIHLDGNVTVSGTAWMDGAVIKNLSADKITTGTLNANNVKITNLSVNDVSGITATYLQSVIGTAFIDWMKGKVIQGYNNNMTIDLLSGNITLNSGSNAIKRIKGTHTAFVHFNDVESSSDGGVGSVYAAIGVTSSGDGVNSMSSGRFAGLRAFRAANGTAHAATLDQTEIYGDTVVILDDFSLVRGFQIRPERLDKRYDLNDDVLNPIRFFVKLLLHLNNVGWNWQDRNFIDALRNEWNAYGMSRYGTFRNNTIYYP